MIHYRALIDPSRKSLESRRTNTAACTPPRCIHPCSLLPVRSDACTPPRVLHPSHDRSGRPALLLHSQPSGSTDPEGGDLLLAGPLTRTPAAAASIVLLEKGRRRRHGVVAAWAPRHFDVVVRDAGEGGAAAGRSTTTRSSTATSPVQPPPPPPRPPAMDLHRADRSKQMRQRPPTELMDPRRTGGRRRRGWRRRWC